MRILIPTSEFPPMAGGVASLAYEQAAGLAALGHDVLVLAVAGRENNPLTATGFRVEYLAITSGAITRLAPLAVALIKRIRAFKPDFIWTPTYRGFGLPISLLCGLKKLPYGVYLHGSEIITEAKSFARRRVMQIVLNRASLVGSNSHNTARLMERNLPGLTTPITVIMPGVNFEKMSRSAAEVKIADMRKFWNRHFNADVSASPAPVYLVSLCRMSRAKGIDLVLQALVKTYQKAAKQNLFYVVAGAGPDLDYFKRMTTQLGLDNKVLFVGAIDYGQTAPVLLAADIFIQPSQPHGHFLESFGISFLEAQAAGLPCVGSNWGGVSEAVLPDQTAILVPTGDVPAIARAIDLLACDSDLRARMGAAGQHWATQNTWKTHGEKLSDFINQATLSN